MAYIRSYAENSAEIMVCGFDVIDEDLVSQAGDDDDEPDLVLDFLGLKVGFTHNESLSPNLTI